MAIRIPGLRACAIGVFLLSAQEVLGANPAGEELELFLGELHSYRADFRQTVVDAEGRMVDEARGELSFRRPGRFRWDYRDPYEQLILADGEQIWIYDPDLEQVTVRPAADARSPMALLDGTRTLRESFEILNEPEADGLQWLRLQPLEPEGDFESVRVGLDRAELVVMIIEDSFGQVTTIELGNGVRNPSLDEGLFVFVPPEGVDVIGAQE